MAKRQTIGRNPLDDLMPETLATATPGVTVPMPSSARASGSLKAHTSSQAPPDRSAARAGGQAADWAGGEAPGNARERPRHVTKKPHSQTQYLTFRLAEEEYAAGILQVKEIIELDMITRVPKTPPFIRGVINLRGSVVPVLDLALKLGLPATSVTERTCIVIVEVDLQGERTVMGVMADGVSQVMELKPADIEAPPTVGVGASVDYVLGMGRAGKKFVLILDIDKVLSSEELLPPDPLTAGGEEGCLIQKEGVSTQPAESGLQ